MKRPFAFAKLTIPPEWKELENEIKLWRTVLDFSIKDAIASTSSAIEERNKREAVEFLLGVTEEHKEHFLFICTLAALDPDLTRERVSHILYTNLWGKKYE